MTDREISEMRVHLYTPAHKGQRRTLSSLSTTAGTLDLDDRQAVERLNGDLVALRDDMHLHASLEERFIHPLLSGRIPAGSRSLEEDHVVMHRHLDDLLAFYGQVRSDTQDRAARQAIALEFYRALNRFISFYLAHIDKEEESVQPTLWAHYSGGELSAAFGRILAAQTPAQLMRNLELMLPAMNIEERVGLVGAARAKMPPEAFRAAAEHAERVLGPSDWAELRPRLGI